MPHLAVTTLTGAALAGDRVDITMLAPDAKFINRSMAVDRPSAIRPAGGLKLRDITAQLGADWHRGSVDRVQPDR
ncbi:MAG TPA: hypothetical protein VHJ17_06340, partial [Thermomonospora sp.]|nr:hypothetical protein [Thermomonospora sp.]